MRRKSTKKGAPPCGIYLKIKPSEKCFTFIEKLKQICLAINASPYEKNMHVIEYVGKCHAKNKDFIVAVKEFLQSQGMVFIIRDDIHFAKEIRADGVIVTTFEEVKKAREIIGSDAIIGIRLIASKKKVEQAFSADLDYISLLLNRKTGGTVIKLLQAWSVTTEKPCLIEGKITNHDCKYLVQSGATFIDGSHYVFGHRSGPLQAVVNMLYAIDLAFSGITKH